MPLRRHRLRRRDFQRVYGEGSRARGAFFAVAVRPNDLGWTRLGLSVGKKVWKGAVRRNRLRRVLREAFRLSLAELPAGVDVVLLVSRPRLEVELGDARRELARLVPKALARYRAKERER